MKNILISISIVGILIGIITYQHKKINEIKEDRNRIESNFYNLNQDLDSIKNKNGEYSYTVSTLELTKKELEKTNYQLVKEVENMKLKIKNLESLTNTEIEYIVKDSFVYVTKDTDTTFISGIKNEWINNTWKSTLTNKGNNLIVSDYQLVMKDSIITPVEIEYKGWWIFKRPKGVRIHIKSKNPYSKINKIEYIRLKK